MPLSILTFNSGDTDYISKHNTNNTNIKAAVDALQSAISSVGGDSTTAVFYEGIFSGQDAILGHASYVPTDSATAHQLNVSSGYAYVASSDAVVTKAITTALDFNGQTTGTYYIHVDATGEPFFDGSSSGALYSVYYDSGTTDFTVITRLAGVVEVAADLTDQRTNFWNIAYDTLDDRIDGAEQAAVSILQKTAVATDITLTDEEAFEHSVLLINDGPQTANILINVPASERVYTVLNDASSSYTCEILPDGGTGYAVTGNYFAILYCDGSTVTPIFLMDRSTGASPSQEYTSLTDTPNSHTGHGGKAVMVNSGGTAHEYVAVQNTPATGETTVPVSSAWAYTHEQAADPHPGYLTPAEGNAAYEPLDATILKEADVDDIPVDGATTDPISSNWAFDHEAAADPHPGYLTQAEADAIYEDDLGNPAADGYHLTSTAAGVRSWVAPGTTDDTLFGTISDQVDQLTVAAALDTLYIVTTGATNGTCTVNLPSPASAGRVIGVTFHAENTGTDTVVIHPATSDEIDGSTSDLTLDTPGQHVTLISDGDGVNWYQLSSITGGSGGGGSGGFTTVSSQSDQATVSAAVDTLYIITTGATNATCTVSLPATAAAGKTIGILYLAENATGDKVVIDPGTDSINGSTTDWEMHVPGQYAEFVANGDDANWYNNGYQASRVFVQTTQPTDFKVGDVWIH